MEDIIKNFQNQMYLVFGAAYGEMQEMFDEEKIDEEDDEVEKGN